MTDHEYDAGMAVLSATERVARLAGFTGALDALPQWLSNRLADHAAAAEAVRAATEEMATHVGVSRALRIELEEARDEIRRLHKLHPED